MKKNILRLIAIIFIGLVLASYGSNSNSYNNSAMSVKKYGCSATVNAK